MTFKESLARSQSFAERTMGAKAQKNSLSLFSLSLLSPINSLSFVQGLNEKVFLSFYRSRAIPREGKSSIKRTNERQVFIIP